MKYASSFYLELLAMYKSGKLTNVEIVNRENKLHQTSHFFLRENYLKKIKLNFCNYHTNFVKPKNNIYNNLRNFKKFCRPFPWSFIQLYIFFFLVLVISH